MALSTEFLTSFRPLLPPEKDNLLVKNILFFWAWRFSAARA